MVSTTLREVAVVRMSDEARDKWTEFATKHGVTVSALLEAAADTLIPNENDPRMRAMIEEARAIDVERRRRG